MPSSDCLPLIFYTLASLLVWLHVHLAQLSDPRSSRRGSAHAVYWVRLHPPCFLHPPPFHVSQSHVTFYCGISVCWYVLGWYPNCHTCYVLTPLMTLLKCSDGGTCFAGRNGLSKWCCCIKSGMNFKRCYKNLNGVILMILLYSAFASEMSKNAVFYFYFHFTEWGNFKSWWWVERAGQRGQRFSLCPRPPRACWSPWHWGRIPKCIPVIPALAMYCSSAHSNTPTIWLGLHEFEVLRISTPTLILPPSPLQLESSCRAWDGDFSGPCNTAAH